MEDLIKQEKFEIEVLEKLKNNGLLAPLVFVGGTMLRLCHNLNRYSVDLDFWFIKKIDTKKFYVKIKKILQENYEIIDSQNKFFTILFEIKTKNYPQRLKIEIRKDIKNCEYEEKIAFSKHSNIQVLVKCLTLQEMLNYKILALLERKEIRDCYDIEFILRKGVDFENKSKEILLRMKKIIEGFKERDYKVTLGSLLEPQIRRYYTEKNFDYLLNRINELLKTIE